MTYPEKPYKLRISVLLLGENLNVRKVRCRLSPVVRLEILASLAFHRESYKLRISVLLLGENLNVRKVRCRLSPVVRLEISLTLIAF